MVEVCYVDELGVECANVLYLYKSIHYGHDSSNYLQRRLSKEVRLAELFFCHDIGELLHLPINVKFLLRTI